MRRLLALACCLPLLLLAGCGDGEVSERFDEARDRAEQVRADVEQRIRDAQEEFEQRRREYGERIDEILRDLDRVFERPERTSPTVRARGRTGVTTIDAFMTDVLQDIDAFWERTFAEADLPQPRVRYNWVEPGGVQLTACGEPADDRAAFYCPADDTVYVAQAFAAALYEGVLEGLPGDGTAAGDFAVAYVLAHEYAHNLQQELGIYDNTRASSAKPFELQADCLAGVWAYSVFAAGALEPGDLEEAANAARAVGDFDISSRQHHGTPDERRGALLTGYETGEPSACNRYLV